MNKTDERLLGLIRPLARERDLLSDARWDALAHSALSKAEDAALREEMEWSPAMAEAYEVFLPINASVKEVMAACVDAGQDGLRHRQDDA